MPKRTQEKQDALRSVGSRATKPRVRLLEVLQRAETPLSIKEIMRQMKNTGVDQATVYRALNALEEKGAVRQVNLRHGHAHYELASDEDHHHLVCVVCGKVENFTGCGERQLTERALKQSKLFAEVHEHAIELFGRCKTCAKKKA